MRRIAATLIGHSSLQDWRYERIGYAYAAAVLRWRSGNKVGDHLDG